MEEGWQTVEVFLPSSLAAHEVRHHAYLTIRIIACEAGDFVSDIRIHTAIPHADGWCKWIAQYLPGPPGVFCDQVVE